MQMPGNDVADEGIYETHIQGIYMHSLKNLTNIIQRHKTCSELNINNYYG